MCAPSSGGQASDVLQSNGACGFLVSDEPWGSYGICPICEWEDDPVMLANPASAGGANEESLAHAQKTILKKYPTDVREARDFRRDPQWRPLTESEIRFYEADTESRHWRNQAINDYDDAYWIGNAEQAEGADAE